METLKSCLISLSVFAFMAVPAVAQEVTAPAEVTSSVEDLIVTARRTDAPIWEVRHGDSTLIMVGSISGVPRDIDWRPEALEAATLRADRILMPQLGTVSIGDIMRMIWRIRTIARLPNNTTTADYLEPSVQARLEAVMANEKSQSWRTNSLVVLSMDLMSDGAGYSNRRTRDAVDVVRQMAREAKRPYRAVGTVRGNEIIDNLITMPPQTYAVCTERAIAAVEAGPEAAQARITDWRNRRVPQVMEQPLEQALGLCWPWGDPEIAPVLREQWSQASATALSDSGVTLAVIQLRVLAESGGVLDQLEAAGYEIEGPVWKKGQTLTPAPQSDDADPVD